MKQIKNYSISTGITLGTILILSFIINIFNYYDLIPKNIYKTILILVTALSILIGSYLLGKKTEKKRIYRRTKILSPNNCTILYNSIPSIR